MQTTDELAEGSLNLYFTEARVTATPSVSGSIDAHSDIILTGVNLDDILVYNGTEFTPEPKPVTLDFDTQSITHSGGSLAIDFTLGRIVLLTLEADIDLLTISSPNVEGIIILTQDSVGNHAILDWGAIKSIDGVIPDYSLIPDAVSFLNVPSVGGEVYVFGAGNVLTTTP